jgi:hypothetical protein
MRSPNAWSSESSWADVIPSSFASSCTRALPGTDGAPSAGIWLNATVAAGGRVVASNVATAEYHECCITVHMQHIRRAAHACG